MDKEKQEESEDKLEGYDIHIDPFGNISSNIKIEEVNEFLNKNIDDKKLKSSQEEE